MTIEEIAIRKKVTTPLTKEELEIVADYLKIDSGIPDWSQMVTPMGRVEGPIFRRLLATIDNLLAQLAASEEKLTAVEEWKRRHRLGLGVKLRYELDRILQGGE